MKRSELEKGMHVVFDTCHGLKLGVVISLGPNKVTIKTTLATWKISYGDVRNIYQPKK